MRMLCVLACILMLGLAICPSAKAGFTVSGSGTGPAGGNVSASAAFSVSGSNLDIVLTNTTPGGTTLRGNLLTGLIFDLSDPGVQLDGLSSVALEGSSELFTNKTTGTTAANLAGSWTSVMASPPAGRYGVATSGLAGLFSAGTITLGGGGEDYSIAASGAFPAPPGVGTSNSFNSAFPLIENSLHFVIPILQGTLDQGGFKSVKFAFGTAGDLITAVPEPGSLVVWGLLIVGVGVYCHRRKTAQRHTA